MGRLITLDFDADLEYAAASAGILVPVRLIHGDRSVELRARLDTGAADCLFDSFYADVLGLPESGHAADAQPDSVPGGENRKFEYTGLRALQGLVTTGE